jgi:hypothetical protein
VRKDLYGNIVMVSHLSFWESVFLQIWTEFANLQISLAAPPCTLVSPTVCTRKSPASLPPV